MLRVFLFFITVFFTQVAMASVTGNLLSFTSSINSVVVGLCLAVGIGFLVASVTQYFQHRKNNLQVPISKPILYLILGLILVALPLLGHHTVGGETLLNQRG